MGITILLLDELDSVIHGFIPANRASHYRNDLKTGSIVRLDRFEVARVAHMYKITEHQFLIRFIASTLQTDAPVIKFDMFMVRHYDHLQVLANTNLELPGMYLSTCRCGMRLHQPKGLKNFRHEQRWGRE
ncbi:unnamed protein product [Brassica oleracea var. botrytis]